MSISMENVVTTGTGAVTGFLFNHTVITSGTMLFVALHSNNSINAAASGTINHIPMNKVDSLSNMVVWMYPNPPIGNNTIRFWVQTTTRTCQAGAVNYKEVDNTTPFQTGTWFNVAYTNVTGSFRSTGTMAVSGTFLEFIGGYDNVTAWYMSPTAGQTQRDFVQNSNRWRLHIADEAGGSGSYVQSWYVSGTIVDGIRHWGRGLNPYVSTPSGTPAIFGQMFRAMIVGLGV